MGDIAKGVGFIFKTIIKILKYIVKGFGWYVGKLLFVFSSKERNTKDKISINEEIF